MGKIIVPTGYMGSGSSAITDVIHEFQGYEAHHDSFEYVFLHCPDGVFDLEDKLLIGNNAIRSDEALHSFRARMEELYYHRFWWPANYKKYLHTDFLKYTEAYVESLIQYKSDCAWYMQQRPSLVMFLKNCVRRFFMLISNGKVKIPYSLRYSPMTLSFVTADEFYSASKEYIYQLFKIMGLDKENLILDQLLLPYNLWRAEKYFRDDMECFVVERDARDIFIINKYIWTKNDEQVPYPIDVEQFCEYYRHLRSVEKKVDNPYIHRFWFEDLIYQYDDSIDRICRILGVNEKEHVKRGLYFEPKRSINNTQLFRFDEYEEETKIIEQKLPEFLYQFPYVRKPELNKSF